MLRRLAFLLSTLVLCLSCAPSANETPPDQVYALRGIVQALPRAGQRDISIHHEAVPGFVNSEGEVVGMGSMTMPFHLADDETIDALAAGDKIAFALEVRWSGRHLVTVRNVVELPPDTVLEFEAPPPHGDDTVAVQEDEAAASSSSSDPPNKHQGH